VETSEVVLSVLGCSRSASYRSIVTAATAAALRYFAFDRAFHIRWIRGTGMLAVRAKADLSPRRIDTMLVTPSTSEAQLFEQAQLSEKPTRIIAVRNGPPGLLRLLGSDEVLLVPVNREFQTPSFIVLDRSISTKPIVTLRDNDAVSTLAITTSLLVENLLLKLRRQRAQKFALTDPLTRLYNRRMGISCLDQELARMQRSSSPTTVLMIDVDDFKKLNDTYGHVQGDQALRAIAEMLRKTLRRSDTICRYGGEEFLVVLPETTAEESSILAARLFTAIEHRGRELGLPLTVSIGQSSIRADDTVESVLQRADKALYASKAQGRNRFSVDADM
jgi:diguanylate cyclase (GGDEF)-like protein